MTGISERSKIELVDFICLSVYLIGINLTEMYKTADFHVVSVHVILKFNGESKLHTNSIAITNRHQ